MFIDDPDAYTCQDGPDILLADDADDLETAIYHLEVALTKSPYSNIDHHIVIALRHLKELENADTDADPIPEPRPWEEDA